MAGSVWDTILSVLPQTSGITKASNALGMAASKNDLQAQLAKLKKDGPASSLQYGAWQDRMDALQKQIATTK